MFAAMVRDEPELLEMLADVSEPAEALQKLFEQRVQLLSNASRVGRSQHLSIPCIATLLLISQQPQVRSIGAESRLYGLLTMQPVKEEITTGDHYPVLQKMLSTWVTNGQSEHYALRIALAYQLRLAGTQLARRLLAEDDVNYSAVAYAAMLLARFGDSADLELLLPHLSNTNVFHTWHNLQLKKEPIRIQVRDAVLAMAIRLTGQQPADYGYKLLREDEATLYKVYTLGFLEDSEREEAFRKWEAWVKDHPDRVAR
jgi:hypothetical protein